MRLGILYVFIILAFATVVRAQEQNTPLALETVARINEWRMAEGTWPLKLNPVLTDLAMSQASYLVSLDDLPDNLHAGASGLSPLERALLEPFNWPHYALPEQIIVGENAGIGSLDYAMGFWETSEIHRSTSLNPNYREIGVAALPYNDAHLFIVVFGARPDVVPALLNPDDNTIYLSNEVVPYADNFESVKSVVELRLFDAGGRPMFDEPQPWSQTLAFPEDAGDAVTIIMTDGGREVVSHVGRETDVVITTSFVEELAVIEAEAEVVPETEAEEVVENVTEIVEATPPPDNNIPDMLILYANDTLDIINVSGDIADWQTLELQGLITVPMTQFTQFTDFDLSAVPDRHCAQIRSNTNDGDVVKPESCRWVRSLISVQPDRLFWIGGDFDVVRGGQVVGTCIANDAVCEVYFDGSPTE